MFEKSECTLKAVKHASPHSKVMLYHFPKIFAKKSFIACHDLVSAAAL